MEAELLRTSDIAQKLGVGRRRVQQMVHAGLIPSVRIGKLIVVPKRAWDDWISDKNRQALESVCDWEKDDVGTKIA